jgi:hypothetical protein
MPKARTNAVLLRLSDETYDHLAQIAADRAKRAGVPVSLPALARTLLDQTVAREHAKLGSK